MARVKTTGTLLEKALATPAFARREVTGPQVAAVFGCKPATSAALCAGYLMRGLRQQIITVEKK